MRWLQYRQKIYYMGAGRCVCVVVLEPSLKENLVLDACLQQSQQAPAVTHSAAAPAL